MRMRTATMIAAFGRGVVLAAPALPAAAQSISKLLGIKVSSSSASFAGQPSTCVTLSVHGKGGTEYSSEPSASLFSLRAGVTTATVPGGGSIP